MPESSVSNPYDPVTVVGKQFAFTQLATSLKSPHGTTTGNLQDAASDSQHEIDIDVNGMDYLQESDPRSNHDDFADCRSVFSQSTYYTAHSVRSSIRRLGRPKVLEKISEYTDLLRDRGLIPVDPMVEKDWSGRGQHVEFEPSENQVVDAILKPQEILGSSSTAIVQSVRCRRILLARKTIRCNRRFTKAKAIEEVAHLSKLNHSHIIQIIGTYSQGNKLSILLYPVADCDLQSFLDTTTTQNISQITSLVTFFDCLSEAVQYIHFHIVKHMDIKPQNILVRRTHPESIRSTAPYKVYIADFGIARSYISQEDAETNGPTMFTRKYAAPEVVDREPRGLPADVFSLGCVFLEMMAVLVDACTRYGGQRAKIEQLLAENEHGDASYQANLPQMIMVLQAQKASTRLWIRGVFPLEEFHRWFFEQLMDDIIPKMIRENPQDRPSAYEICLLLNSHRPCCGLGADPIDTS